MKRHWKAKQIRDREHDPRVAECCSGKCCYPTKAVCLQEAARVGGLRNVDLRAYKCPFCKFWHMTSRVHQRPG